MAEGKFHLKHIEIWIIAFVLALGGAITAFVFAFTGFGSKVDPGFYEITATNKEKIPFYASDFTFLYYLEGSKNEVTAKRNEIGTLYSDELSILYANLNDEETYENIHSIGEINAHPNEDVTIDNRTYLVLKDAYSKSVNSNNFSIFANPLYTFWYQNFALLNNEEKIQRDPINNTYSKEFLNAFATIIKDRDAIDLTFKDNNIVHLTVSDSYKSLAEEYEVEPIYIGLNVLKNAYIIDELMSFFDAKGYTKGVVVTREGITSFGRGHSANNYSFYETTDTQINKIGNVKLNSPSGSASFHRFDINQYKYSNYYEFSKDGVKYYRSINIDINSGLCRNDFFVTQVYSGDGSVVKQTFINNEFSAMSSIEEIKNYLDNNGFASEMVLLDFNKNDKTIYVSESLYNFVSLLDGLDYNLIKF